MDGPLFADSVKWGSDRESPGRIHIFSIGKIYFHVWRKLPPFYKRKRLSSAVCTAMDWGILLKELQKWDVHTLFSISSLFKEEKKL